MHKNGQVKYKIKCNWRLHTQHDSKKAKMAALPVSPKRNSSRKRGKNKVIESRHCCPFVKPSFRQRSKNLTKRRIWMQNMNLKHHLCFLTDWLSTWCIGAGNCREYHAANETTDKKHAPFQMKSKQKEKLPRGQRSEGLELLCVETSSLAAMEKSFQNSPNLSELPLSETCAGPSMFGQSSSGCLHKKEIWDLVFCRLEWIDFL